MNKKILISLSVIGVVAAIAVGGTIAFFSDTETSTGNTFTAGSLDLLVDSDCAYNGMECIGGFWDEDEKEGNECSCVFDEKNLTVDDLFFNFSDVKPGDSGEDTISLHVYDNDAWACVTLGPLTNQDNGCNEPEGDVDTTCDDLENVVLLDVDEVTPLDEGELAQNLMFRIWADVCDYENEIGEYWYGYEDAEAGDNVYQPQCDIPLTEGPASGDPLTGVTWTLADKNYNVFTGSGPLIGSTTYYIGVAWWVDSTVGNIIQSDSVGGDISFYAVQSRNNATFDCQAAR